MAQADMSRTENLTSKPPPVGMPKSARKANGKTVMTDAFDHAEVEHAEPKVEHRSSARRDVRVLGREFMNEMNGGLTRAWKELKIGCSRAFYEVVRSLDRAATKVIER
jgi:hypothetical protein